MNALLTIIDAIPPSGLTTIEAESVLEFAENAKSAGTRRAYASDWRDFAAWCAARGATPLPAQPAIICAYVSTLAHGGKRASTLGRRIAALAHYHSQAGFRPSPTADETVRVVMRGIRRTIGAAPVQKTPATHVILAGLLETCSGDRLLDVRDRALLCLGFAGAFRRSELVALEVADLTEVPDGLRILIRRSKGDQEGQGQEVAIPRGYRLRPVEALQAWLARAEITSGPVFRPIIGARVGDGPLSAYSVATAVQRRCRLAGIDPSTFAAHSLRSGYLTSAAESGASIFKMIEQSRHKSMDTLRSYVRSADRFKEHSGAAFL
jgi:site-specific recombinase XerD